MNYGVLLLSSLFSVAMLALPAPAQSVRTFVASTGNDANPCSRTAPCRTYQAAVNAAASGGEVVALDSAGFGSNITINKPISIIGSPGGYAGITVFSGDGIDINAGSTDTVVLRGLSIINQGSIGNGIVFSSGGTLHVESCVISGFRGPFPVLGGLVLIGAGILEVKDSIMRGNNNGIRVQGTASATIDHVVLDGNPDGGLVVLERSRVTVRNTVASNNGSGFDAASFQNSVELNIENCIASNNFLEGIGSASNGTGVPIVRVSNSTITNNGVGLRNFGGLAVLLSRGNNTVEANTTNTSGAIGSYSAK
jgi:hypothetical protein